MQAAYNSGKPGNLWEFMIFRKLGEFEMGTRGIYYIRCIFSRFNLKLTTRQVGNLTFPQKAKAD